jgi:hypothetical protein
MNAVPNHTSSCLATWRWLLTEPGAKLIRLAGEITQPEVADIARLRRHGDQDQVRIALELVSARRRAVHKFESVDDFWCDLPGIEQATSEAIADWKAARFERHGVSEVIDACSGIGGDARSLARSSSVEAIDFDPVRAWMTERNAGCTVRVADVTTIVPDGRHLHIDPSRRHEASGKRHWRLEHLQPSWAECSALLAASPGGACKLGPGVPMPFPDRPAGSELEFIQHHGRMVQCVLWTGDLAENPEVERATILPEGLTLSGEAIEMPYAERLPEAGDWLLEARPALERAGLIGCGLEQQGIEAGELAPGLGLLLSDVESKSPWFTDWKIEAVLNLRERPVSQWLKANDGGEVTARTRGGVIDVDKWASSLRGSGTRRFVVFGLRIGSISRAIVCAARS